MKVDVKQLARIPFVAPFFYFGAMLCYVVLILAHELGHYLAASLVNPSAISGFYFPVENAWKLFLFQKLTAISECPGAAACVTYKASLLDSFGQVGGFVVGMAGVATTVVLLVFLLKVKRSVVQDIQNRNGIARTSQAAFLLGVFLMSLDVSVEWISDGERRLCLLFTMRTLPRPLLLRSCYSSPSSALTQRLTCSYISRQSMRRIMHGLDFGLLRTFGLNRGKEGELHGEG